MHTATKYTEQKLVYDDSQCKSEWEVNKTRTSETTAVQGHLLMNTFHTGRSNKMKGPLIETTWLLFTKIVSLRRTHISDEHDR